MTPDGFDWIQIWGVRRPFKGVDAPFSKPLSSDSCNTTYVKAHCLAGVSEIGAIAPNLVLKIAMRQMLQIHVGYT